MAYDPYGGQTPEQQMSASVTAKDFLTYGVNPSSYLTMATTNPFMWSSKKGVLVPFVGKRWAEGRMKYLGKDLTTGFKNTYTKGVGNAITGTLKGAGRLTKNIFSMGMTAKAGGGFVGGELLQRDLQAEWRSMARQQARYRKKLLGMDIHKGMYERNSTYKKLIVKDKKVLKSKLTKLSTKMDKVRGLIPYQNMAKWGIRAAKVGSAVGLAMFAWDVGTMIAKPLAQTAMGAIERMASEYSNRFMPEMGGQLQLSYLSQGAATERQRSIQAISKSYINGRSAFGSEANMMHDR